MIRRNSLTWPIVLAAALLALIVALLVLWVIGQAASQQWALLTVGAIFIVLVLIGVVIYLILTIKATNLNLRQANFIDSVTHELKSPIASIKLCLQTLDMRQVSPEQQREFHRFMLEDVQRLDSLIDHLLTAAQLDHPEPIAPLEDVPLEPLIQSCAAAIRRRYQLAEEQIQVHIQPCIVRGNLRDLEMVFSNLIDNAVKYAGKEPQVIVEGGPQGKERVQARISDNGGGVRYELRRKIFKRFFRGGSELERTTQGTGLGLYLVRSLVRRMKGRVHVHGRGPLNGATFEVDLPGSALNQTISSDLPPAGDGQVVQNLAPGAL